MFSCTQGSQNDEGVLKTRTNFNEERVRGFHVLPDYKCFSIISSYQKEGDRIQVFIDYPIGRLYHLDSSTGKVVREYTAPILKGIANVQCVYSEDSIINIDNVENSLLVLDSGKIKHMYSLKYFLKDTNVIATRISNNLVRWKNFFLLDLRLHHNRATMKKYDSLQNTIPCIGLFSFNKDGILALDSTFIPQPNIFSPKRHSLGDIVTFTLNDRRDEIIYFMKDNADSVTIFNLKSKTIKRTVVKNDHYPIIPRYFDPSQIIEGSAHYDSLVNSFDACSKIFYNSRADRLMRMLIIRSQQPEKKQILQILTADMQIEKEHVLPTECIDVKQVDQRVLLHLIDKKNKKMRYEELLF